MLIGRAFCRLLAVGCLLNWKFCWFWLYLRDFHFLDYQGHPKSSPQKIRDNWGLWKGGSDPPWSTRHTHLEITTTGEDLSITRLTCKSGVNFRNRYVCWSQWPIQSIQLWSQFFLVWIWTSWKLFNIECQYQTDEFCPLESSSFSAFVSVEQVQDWAAIYIRRLGPVSYTHLTLPTRRTV